MRQLGNPDEIRTSPFWKQYNSLRLLIIKREGENKKMKRNLRFLIFGLVLACVAALGFSHGAWAGPLMNGTVPSCNTFAANLDTSDIGDTITTCHATATGDGFSMSDQNLADEGMVPGSLNFGPAVDLETNGNLVEVCFFDVDTPPVGNIWHWMTPADWLNEYHTVQPGSWVYWPTYHKAGNLTCTRTWDSGIYTIEY